MQELVGKKINAIFVDAEDQDVLQFKTDGGDVIYEGYGDCCSETWFADITGFDALIGGTVISVETVEMPDPEDGRSRQDYDKVYGYKIITDKGHADIVYRNSSNGYYGGSCDLTTKESNNMTQITDDWSA